MSEQELTGKVQTVLGVIDAEDIGITTCHEHILWDISPNFQEPRTAGEKGMAHQPVTLAKRPAIRDIIAGRGIVTIVGGVIVSTIVYLKSWIIYYICPFAASRPVIIQEVSDSAKTIQPLQVTTDTHFVF